MAKKELVENIVKLYSKLGGNMNDVLGSRSNVTFLGTGKNPEPFVEMDINMEAVGALGKSKILEELKSPLGYLTADKLNDIQATKLYNNMLKLEEFYYPKQTANITDMATGTRNLDTEGLMSLRQGDPAKFRPNENLPSLAELRKTQGKLNIDEINRLAADEGVDAAETILPMRNIDEAYGVDTKAVNKFMKDEGLDLPPRGSRGGSDDIAAPLQSAEETFRKLEAQGQGDLANQLREAMMKGPLSKVGNKGDIPAKRASAREFLVEALKKDEYDKGVNFGKTQLNNVISAEDVKYITEGGGGIGGDPIVLVEKYFGPRIAEALPAGATGDEIVRFTNRVLENVTDAAGLKPDNPRFDRMTAKFIDDMADGGRAGFRFGRSAGKAFGLMKKAKAIEKSVDAGEKMGYQALREYGLEAEDITRLFRELAMDRTMVGPEKTAYFKMLNQVLKNPAKFPDGILEIKKRLGLDYADGGRAGFKLGKSVFSGIANMFKRGADDVDLVKQEETFRTGPITEKFLGDVDKKVIEKFIRTRETSGPGSYGMYDNIAEMPQGLQAAEFINKIRIPGKNQIDYERAEMFIGGGVKLTGKETVDELIEMFLNSMKSYKSPFKAAKGGLAKILEV
tara:strand:- start:3228 stop:5096 length:1869 start_codon:yes stop_codon:yes gene_type:complete